MLLIFLKFLFHKISNFELYENNFRFLIKLKYQISFIYFKCTMKYYISPLSRNQDNNNNVYEYHLYYSIINLYS